MSPFSKDKKKDGTFYKVAVTDCSPIRMLKKRAL